jgi:hypothetical protein
VISPTTEDACSRRKGGNDPIVEQNRRIHKKPVKIVACEKGREQGDEGMSVSKMLFY